MQCKKGGFLVRKWNSHKFNMSKSPRFDKMQLMKIIKVKMQKKGGVVMILG